MTHERFSVLISMTYLRILHDARYIWLDSVCDAKIDQFQRSIHYDEVSWFQVAVDNSYTEHTCSG